MNDFERKLSQQPFRAPPSALRDAIFGIAEAPPNLVELTRWTWRDWLWPSPQAWAALAALWLIFAAVSMGGHLPSGPALASRTAPPELNGTLLSYHVSSNLNHALELAN